jgi:hypothetical protein
MVVSLRKIIFTDFGRKSVFNFHYYSSAILIFLVRASFFTKNQPKEKILKFIFDQKIALGQNFKILKMSAIFIFYFKSKSLQLTFFL